MSKKKDSESSKDWECQKCGEEYRSPIRVSAVLCHVCTKRERSKEIWMTPLEK